MEVSHTEGAEGGFVSVKQEHEEVKWCCSLWIDFLFTSCVIFNAPQLIINTCPQLMNNTDYKLSRNCGFINADVKEECSSEFPNSSNNEGILFYIFIWWCTVLIFVLWHVSYLFDIHVTGRSASEPVHDNEDIVDLKEEPIEVSCYILWVCAQIITNVVESMLWGWILTDFFMVFLSNWKWMSFIKVLSSLPMLTFHLVFLCDPHQQLALSK